MRRPKSALDQPVRPWGEETLLPSDDDEEEEEEDESWARPAAALKPCSMPQQRADVASPARQGEEAGCRGFEGGREWDGGPTRGASWRTHGQQQQQVSR